MKIELGNHVCFWAGGGQFPYAGLTLVPGKLMISCFRQVGSPKVTRVQPYSWWRNRRTYLHSGYWRRLKLAYICILPWR